MADINWNNVLKDIESISKEVQVKKSDTVEDKVSQELSMDNLLGKLEKEDKLMSGELEGNSKKRKMYSSTKEVLGALKIGLEKNNYNPFIKKMKHIGVMAINEIRKDPNNKDIILGEFYGVLLDMEAKNKIRHTMYGKILRTYGVVSLKVGYTLNDPKRKIWKEYWDSRGQNTKIKLKDLRIHKTVK